MLELIYVDVDLLPGVTALVTRCHTERHQVAFALFGQVFHAFGGYRADAFTHALGMESGIRS